MALTKDIANVFFIQEVDSVKKQTINENDLTDLFTDFDNLCKVQAFLEQEEKSEMWNAIVIDTIASINSALSGFYKNAIMGLRGIFEMGCGFMYYYDHEIEYKMFIFSDGKADKYVNTLVDQYDFFKTKYINVSCSRNISIKTESDNISIKLKALYATLSDYVHGRYKTITSAQHFTVSYDKNEFEKFKSLFTKTINLLIVLTILRFNITFDNETEIIKKAGVPNND